MTGNNLKEPNLRDEILKVSSGELDAWERRVRTVEGHLQEDQVSPIRFDILCERTPKSIFNVAEGIKNEPLSRALEKAISELSSNQRKIIQLFFWEGLSEQEIANATKMPRKTISNRKFSAFREIAEKCGQFFLSYEGTSKDVLLNPKPDIQSLIDTLFEQKISGRKI